jgi:hypothetical protein
LKANRKSPHHPHLHLPKDLLRLQSPKLPSLSHNNQKSCRLNARLLGFLLVNRAVILRASKVVTLHVKRAVVGIPHVNKVVTLHASKVVTLHASKVVTLRVKKAAVGIPHANRAVTLRASKVVTLRVKKAAVTPHVSRAVTLHAKKAVVDIPHASKAVTLHVSRVVTPRAKKAVVDILHVSKVATLRAHNKVAVTLRGNKEHLVNNLATALGQLLTTASQDLYLPQVLAPLTHLARLHPDSKKAIALTLGDLCLLVNLHVAMNKKKEDLPRVLVKSRAKSLPRNSASISQRKKLLKSALLMQEIAKGCAQTKKIKDGESADLPKRCAPCIKKKLFAQNL